LKQRGVYRFDATIDVAADGSITGSKLSPGGDLPANLEAPLADALRKAVLVPAVDNGKFVAGVYNYHFAIPR
jgi:hypothetical protein